MRAGRSKSIVILGFMLLLQLIYFILIEQGNSEEVFEKEKFQEILEKDQTFTQSEEKSSSGDSQESYFFIVITKSAPQSIDDRNLLRQQSWLSYEWKDINSQEISWRHFFLVGLSIDPEFSRAKMQEENDEYGDILISPTLDSYRRMTYKLMWAFQHLIETYKFMFLIVLSEDTIVNVRDLHTYLQKQVYLGNHKRFHGGTQCKIRQIHRTGKAAITKLEWPNDLLPKLCIGSGFMFSFDVIEELLEIWDDDKQPVNPLDDVQIAILLLMSGKIPIREISQVSHGCKKRNSDSFIVSQIKPLEKGVELIRNYMQHGFYCFENIKPHRVHFPGEENIVWV